MSVIVSMNSKAVQRFAKNMKSIREMKGMSQGDIYRATKIDRAYISNLEAGKQNPTLETIEKIAGALGVEVSELTKKTPNSNLSVNQQAARISCLSDSFSFVNFVIFVATHLPFLSVISFSAIIL